MNEQKTETASDETNKTLNGALKAMVMMNVAGHEMLRLKKGDTDITYKSLRSLFNTVLAFEEDGVIVDPTMRDAIAHVIYTENTPANMDMLVKNLKVTLK